MSHTKEPWFVSSGRDGQAVAEIVVGNGSPLRIRANALEEGDAKEDARRIVACVNACAGIETHELELMVGRMCVANQIKACDTINDDQEAKAERRSKFAKQRDVLLAALEVVVEQWSSQFERNGHLAPAWCKQARDAIASAKGGAA